MEPRLKAFTDAIEQALTQSNWVAALATALTLPDICGWLENPAFSTSKRYVSWFDKYVGPRYLGMVGPGRERHVFLSGKDCYALRCAILHEGSSQTIRQRAHQALTAFRFVAPKAGWTIHKNHANSRLQLQVDIFCRDLCAGVEEWQRSVLLLSTDAQARLTELLTVELLGSSVTI